MGTAVYISDISQAKLDYAFKFGVDGTILSRSDEAMRQKTADITGSDGFVVTIEAVGLPSTFQQAIDAAAYAGRVVLIGISKQRLDFDFTVIQRKELNVYGVAQRV